MRKLNSFFNGFSSKKKGFTLIEILVVIGIMAVLATIVIIAINPAKQFAQARNADRTAGVEAILNAVGQRLADNKGVFEGKFNVGDDPTTTTTVEGTDYFCGKIPSNTATPVVFTSIDTSNEVVGNIDKESGKLGCLVPTYISALPKDPTWAIGTNTLYTINKNSTGRISVCAPLGAEAVVPNSAEICITR